MGFLLPFLRILEDCAAAGKPSMTAKDKYQILQATMSRWPSDNPPATLGNEQRTVSARELQHVWGGGPVASLLPQQKSIYLHVPYCAQRRCSFCMYKSSTAFTPETLSGYASSVHRMIRLFSPQLTGEITNVYVGGGTPTVYSPDDLASLLRPLADMKYRSEGERTCEMSPTTATESHVEALASLGFNRISVGAQSFDRSVLDQVNRAYVEPEKIALLASRARSLNFVDVNVDLMFGLPGTTVPSMRNSVALAIETGALSISIYNYRRRSAAANLDKETRKDMVAQFHAACEVMASYGWECYAGDESTEYHLFFSPKRTRNTIRYQTSSNGVENYSVFGFGAYANGFNPALNYTCISDGMEFSSGGAQFRYWVSSVDRQIRLGVINILYARGNQIDKSYFRKVYGMEFSDYFQEEIADLVGLGKAEDDDKSFRLRAVSHVDSIILQRFFLPMDMVRR